jgi:inorganic phosphate transporter, PiT family
MTDITMTAPIGSGASPKPKLDHSVNPLSIILFFGALAAALLFVAYSIYSDVEASGTRITTYLPFLLLFVALVTALGFEFVNGFHDTANAVATVIYTHAMPAPIAVVWSGFFIFSACSCHRARWRSASCRCCLWSLFCRSAARPVSPWCSHS